MRRRMDDGGRRHAQTSSSGGWFSGLFGNSSKPAAPADASDPADDALALKNEKEPGVELYVAVARLYVETGKYVEAENQYRQAMKKDPDDIRVLLGYAVLKDQMNQPEEALKFYRKAEKKYPKEPAVYNDLAIHFIRGGMIGEAIESARRAVDLRPSEPRYRNNLAAMLVEAGQPQEAFRQLRAVYDEPMSHYNLGFLLNKRGWKPAALQEFSIAFRQNPRMVPARQWVERLSQELDANNTALGVAPPQRPVTMAPQPAYPPREMPQPAMMAPQPPQFVAPPRYAAPPDNAAPPQYRIAGPLPAQPQYAPWPPPAPPQDQAPQYQNATFAAGGCQFGAADRFRDTGVRALPPASNDDNVRRLPAVGKPVRDSQSTDPVAPDPPGWQR